MTRRINQISPQARAFLILVEDMLEEQDLIPKEFRYSIQEYLNGRERGYVLSIGHIANPGAFRCFFAENRNSDNHFLWEWFDAEANVGMLDELPAPAEIPAVSYHKRAYFAPYDYSGALFDLRNRINGFIEDMEMRLRKDSPSPFQVGVKARFTNPDTAQSVAFVIKQIHRSKKDSAKDLLYGEGDFHARAEFCSVEGAS